MSDDAARPNPFEPGTHVVAPATHCGAKRRRDGLPCRNVAGYKTDHVGQGKCYMHGGRTPIRHGRYSLIKRPRIRELIHQFEQDKDPLNILPEIAALRALFVDFIDRYATHREALLAWHASFQLTRRPLPPPLIMAFERIVDEWEIALKEERVDESPGRAEDIVQARKFLQVLREGTESARPRQVLDISDAYRVLDAIGKMVERVEKARSANAISRADMNRIMQEMWRSVDARVTDEAAKKQIVNDWMLVRLA